MRTKIIKGLFILFAGYLLLFTGKLIFNLTKTSSENEGLLSDLSFYSEKTDLRKNYQTENQVNSAGIFYEEKYEQTAFLNGRTDTFDEHRKLLFETVEDYKAVIQSENTVENANTKNLYIIAGVDPGDFSRFVDALKAVLPIDSINITKVDKTNDYREMIATRTSLEKNRDSLISLKKKEGKIEEYITLEEKILDIENRIQALGVNLGDFDSVKSLSTAKITLSEKKIVSTNIWIEIIDAGSWAFMAYSIIIIIGLISVLVVCMSIVVYEKAKKILVKLKMEK